MSLTLYCVTLSMLGMISLWSLFYTWISLQVSYYLNAIFGSILTVVSAILFFKMIFLRGIK